MISDSGVRNCLPLVSVVRAGRAEWIMQTRDEWRQYLSELVNARLDAGVRDPVVYAVQWARNPRGLRRGSSRRASTLQLKSAAGQFWSPAGVQYWK